MKPAAKKKLSYLEAREFATIEQRIAEAEETLQQKRAAAEDPAIASDAAQLLKAHAEMEEAQKAVDELYARWAELEASRAEAESRPSGYRRHAWLPHSPRFLRFHQPFYVTLFRAKSFALEGKTG